ncbi:unnamed protein product [marine sediment metagenome]|uniref:Uncharacterized protein n=1 Tax=marine sediment metagenome TaxID=412755 RepID=X1KRD1_9ZZZZ
MRSPDTLTITVRPLDARATEYLASCHSELYGADFCRRFPDSITGAFALHCFADMLHDRYSKPVVFDLDHAPAGVHATALLEVLADSVPQPHAGALLRRAG